MPLVLSGTNGISTNGTNWALQPDSTGRVRLPNQAFIRATHAGNGSTAIGNNSFTTLTSSYGTWSVAASAGGFSFNTTTGAMTVPVTGTYLIGAKGFFSLNNDNISYHIRFIQNGSNPFDQSEWRFYTPGVTQGDERGRIRIETTTLISLVANDTWQIQVTTVGSSDQYMDNASSMWAVLLS